MDRQKMFDRAWHYYVTEGHPPSIRKSRTGDSPTCMYFDKDTGNRCAVGIQLTPEQARRMPRETIYVLLARGAEAFGQIIQNALYGDELRRILGVEQDDDIGFLTKLQNAHDHAAVGRGHFPALFRVNMRILAAHWNLTIPGEAAPEAVAEEEAVLCAQ